MYKLFTDKSELFECSINLEGASLNKSIARILIESEDYNLVFNGSINSNGKCKIPIKKLKGLIQENSKGNIKLEVIAEDTYFTPWESTYSVDAAKKVTVEVKQQSKPVMESKPSVSVKEVKRNLEPTENVHISRLVKIFIKENITLLNLPKKKHKVGKIIEVYTRKYPIDSITPESLIEGVLEKLWSISK
jgi:hypothetical protein